MDTVTKMGHTWSIGITHTIPGRRGAALGSAILSTGELVVRLHDNLRGRQEIGHYRHQFPMEVVDRVVALVDHIGLWQLVDVQRGPDEPFASFNRDELGKMITHVSWPLRHLPPEVEPLISMFNHLADEARQSPVEVLAGDAAWVRPVVRPREPLEFGFRLFNPGRESIEVQSPRTPIEDFDSSVTLLLSQLDVAPDPENPNAGFSRLPVLAESLVRVGHDGPRVPTQVELLDLATGDEVRFTASLGAYLAPGRYRGVILFESFTPERPGPRATLKNPYPKRRGPPRDPLRPSPIYGELAMELPVLTVEEPGRG